MKGSSNEYAEVIERGKGEVCSLGCLLFWDRQNTEPFLKELTVLIFCRSPQDVPREYQLQVPDHSVTGWRFSTFDGQCGCNPVFASSASGVQFALPLDRLLSVAELHCRNAAIVHE